MESYGFWRPESLTYVFRGLALYVIVIIDFGKLAAVVITVTAPFCPAILAELCHQAGAAEAHKLHWTKMPGVGLDIIPLAAETYSNWGKEALDIIGWHLTWPLASPSPSQ